MVGNMSDISLVYILNVPTKIHQQWWHHRGIYPQKYFLAPPHFSPKVIKFFRADFLSPLKLFLPQNFDASGATVHQR